PIEQREFALYRGDRMDGVGPADTLRPRFAKAEEAHLALFDETRHRANRVLDRHRGIDAVLVIEVDDIDAEPLEARLAGLNDIFGAAVDAIGAARPPGLAEFRCDHAPAAAAVERAAQQFLVLSPAIHVRAVEMVAPELNRAMDEAHSSFVVARPVDAREGHAAEADRRALRTRLTEPALFHDDGAAH